MAELYFIRKHYYCINKESKITKKIGLHTIYDIILP